MSGASRHLLLVAHGDAQPQVRFCGHCGESPAETEPQAASRVCGRCGLGLVLQAGADAAPAPGEPFLLVDQSLAVCALSKRAEALLGVGEPEAVHRPITDFLVPADVEGPGPDTVVADLLAAGARGGDPLRTVLRPAGEFGVRLFARLAACGPPRAALIVLSDA